MNFFFFFAINYLIFPEQHPCVSGLSVAERPGVTLAQWQDWEAVKLAWVGFLTTTQKLSREHPLIAELLPADYRAFMSMSNGLKVTWNVSFGGCVNFEPLLLF